MTDQERVADFLSSEKKLSANYDLFASECVSVPLRDQFIKLFTQTRNNTDFIEMIKKTKIIN